MENESKNTISIRVISESNKRWGRAVRETLRKRDEADEKVRESAAIRNAQSAFGSK